MRLKELLGLIGDSTQVEVYDKEGEILFGIYDGKQSLAKALNNCHIDGIITNEGKIVITIRFEVERFFRHKNREEVLKMYLNWLGIKNNYKLINSQNGTMYYTSTNNYIYSQEELYEIMLQNEDFITYVLENVEAIELAFSLD